MTDTDIPEALLADVARVFNASRECRAIRATTAFKLLRPYERRIVRDAAVMGYVLGHQDGLVDMQQHRTVAEIQARYPKDMAILQDVLEHCDSTSDRYPYLGAACDGRRRRVTRKQMWPGEETW